MPVPRFCQRLVIIDHVQPVKAYIESRLLGIFTDLNLRVGMDVCCNQSQASKQRLSDFVVRIVKEQMS